MVRRMSTSDVISRYVKGVQDNADRYLEGVRTTDKDPLALAAKALPKAKAAYADAVDSGKIARGLAASSKAEWQAGATAAGAGAYTAGVENKRAKIARKMDAVLTQTYDVADSVENLPTDTIQQRIAKSSQYQQKRYDAARGSRAR